MSYKFARIEKSDKKLRKMSADDQEVANNNESLEELFVEISTVSDPDSIEILFPKKYFKTINVDKEGSKIYIFDRFLMISTENTDLLISTEVSA